MLRNVRTSADQNTLGAQAVRGQVVWQPSTDFRLRLIADFSNFDSECCTQVYLRVGTSLRPAARQFPRLAALAGYTPASTNPYDRLTDRHAEGDRPARRNGFELVVSFAVIVAAFFEHLGGVAENTS